jgi:hypothetical protein
MSPKNSMDGTIERNTMLLLKMQDPRREGNSALPPHTAIAANRLLRKEQKKQSIIFKSYPQGNLLKTRED